MRFGIMLDNQFQPGDDIATRISELVEITQAARDLGLHSVFAVHHYLAPLVTLQPLSLLARLSAHSGTMRLGTGVFIATLVHPVHLAEETATIDRLSGGRLVLGVGTGYRAEEFDAFGIELTQRSRRLVETISVLRALWSGEPVHHEGKAFRLTGQHIGVTPVQRPGPPIWVGANSAAGVRRAARVGDAWLASPNVKINWAIGHRQIFADELAAMGQPNAEREYPILRELYLGDDADAWRNDVGEQVARSYASYAPYQLDYFQTRFDELREKAFLFGTPDTVAERVKLLADAGFTEIICRVNWLGTPMSVALRTLQRLATDVMPRFAVSAREAPR
jgi:alkanesulfonate monooxygenase SsuD/methylene tetrahydromethanopterin reductase-like flavin-dependent oxidoreductase (luciferase family)